MVGYDVDGGLGEWMVIPAVGVRAGRLVPAPDGLPPEQLSLAEPLACCLNGLDQYRVDVGDVVVILGAGPIGLFHLQLAVIGGARTVIVSDPSESRRKVAAELGAHVTVDPTERGPRCDRRRRDAAGSARTSPSSASAGRSWSTTA